MSWRLFEGLASRRMINAIGFCNWHIIYGQASLIIRIRSVVQLQLTPRQLQQQMETETETELEMETETELTADSRRCQGYFNKSSSFVLLHS